MKEIQRISVSGRNWNDIIALPCVYRIDKTYDDRKFCVWLRLLSLADPDEGISSACYGDTLVEYEDHKWRVIHAEDGLDRKIAQATPKWVGVDADKFVSEIRGRED